MSKVRADFQGLLELAETLHRSSEELHESYRGSLMARQGLLLFLILEAYFGFFIGIYSIGIHDAVFHAHLLSPLIAVALAIADLLIIVVTAFYAYSFSLRSKRLWYAQRADQQYLTEAVELLREIEPVVAREGNLSALERFQIRVRLSRFGIGASWRDGEGPASKASSASFGARKSRVDQGLMKPL